MSERLKLTEYFVAQYTGAAVRAIQGMPSETAGDYIEAIEDSLSLSALSAMLPSSACSCLEAMPRPAAAKYLDQMAARDAAAILRHGSKAVRDELVALLSRRQSVRISMLLRYRKNLVGGCMENVEVAILRDASVGEACEQVAKAGYFEREVFVVDGENRVIGAVAVADLLKDAESGTPIASIMKPLANPIPAVMTARQAAESPQWSDRDVLPVIEHDRKLVGIIRLADLWRELATLPDSEPVSSANPDVFVVAEVCCLGLADLVTAMLSKGRDDAAA